MPRAGQTTTALSASLPQRVVLGVLMRSFPPAHIDQILDIAGRREQRQRLLPARLMVYFTLGLWIFGALSYEAVLAEILRDVPGLTAHPPRETASAAAIGRARQRLGEEPLRLLFEEVAGAAAAAAPEPVLPGGWRLLRLSGVSIDVPATPANRVEFGGGGLPAPTSLPATTTTSTATASPIPRVQLSLLTDDCTHQIIAASIGTSLGPAPDQRIAAAMGPGTLVIVDGWTLSGPLWSSVAEPGCDQIWPVGDEVRFPVHKRLPDGSYLSVLGDAPGHKVRVVNRAVVRGLPRTARPGGNGVHAASRLVTSVLDHRAARADELAAVYDLHESHGHGFDGIRAYQIGDRLVLRSKSPDLVRQELYAMLCVHHAIGELVDYTLLDGPSSSAKAR